MKESQLVWLFWILLSKSHNEVLSSSLYTLAEFVFHISSSLINKSYSQVRAFEFPFHYRLSVWNFPGRSILLFIFLLVTKVCAILGTVTISLSLRKYEIHLRYHHLVGIHNLTYIPFVVHTFAFCMVIWYIVICVNAIDSKITKSTFYILKKQDLRL